MKWDRTVWKDGLCSRSQFLGYVTVWNLCADIWMERIFLCQILGATVLLYAAGIICGIESCGQSISRNDARCVACSYYLLNRELLKSADNPVALGLQVIYQIKLVCLGKKKKKKKREITSVAVTLIRMKTGNSNPTASWSFRIRPTTIPSLPHQTLTDNERGKKSLDRHDRKITGRAN